MPSPVVEPPSADPELDAARWARTRAVLLGLASFREWCEWWVSIESDTPGVRGAIPFRLHEYQWDRAIAWERGDSEVILKARQLGFTWLAASYALWVACYHPSSHVAVLSAGAREMRKFMRRVRFIWRRLPPALQGGAIPAMESIAFANESMISGFPSTEDAGIGETNRVVILDEWAFHPYGEANLSAILPTIAAGGQLLGMSTADPQLGPTGHFYEQWQAAVGGKSGFTPVFVPWNARPGRDAAWLERERSRHVGSDQAFRAFYPERPEDAFQGREGLVYPSAGPHLCRPAPVPWEECYLRFYGTDYGGNDPTAIVVGGVYRSTSGPRLHIYDVLYQARGQALTVDAVATWLLEWHRRGPFARGADDPAPGGELIAETLRQVHRLPARRADNKRFEGIELVRQWIDGSVPMLTFEPGPCWDGFAREFASYRAKPATDPNGKERYDTSTPVDHHGDRLDALRYLVMAAYLELLRDQPRTAYREARW